MTVWSCAPVATRPFLYRSAENEKSEPFSNWKPVRIFLVWWAMRDSNPHWIGYEPTALTVKLMALVSLFRVIANRLS